MDFVRDNRTLKESIYLKLPRFWDHLKKNCFEISVLVASSNTFHNLSIPMYIQTTLLDSESWQEIEP